MSAPLLMLDKTANIPGGAGVRVSYSIIDTYSREPIGMLQGHVIGDTFFVDDFGGGKWSLGTKGVLSIIRQLKFDFRVIKHLSGPRITGARMVHGIVNGSGHASLERHFGA